MQLGYNWVKFKDNGRIIKVPPPPLLYYVRVLFLGLCFFFTILLATTENCQNNKVRKLCAKCPENLFIVEEHHVGL
jgi:hypothetical protein